MDKTGAMTLEASIIVPLILIMVMTLVVALIVCFNCNLDLLQGHRQTLISNEDVTVTFEDDLMGYPLKLDYTSKGQGVSVQELQEVLAFIVATVDYVYGGFIHE